MKKVFLGLLVAGMGLGFSAFTNAHRASDFNYGLNADGTAYVKITGAVNEGSCFNSRPNACVLGWQEDKGSSFLISNIPANPDYTSVATASYFH